VKIHLYGYGALLLVCAALYAWSAVLSARLDGRDAQIERYKHDVLTLQANVDQARATAAANEQAVKDIQNDLDRQAETSYRFEDLARRREVELQNALRRIADAPASDDGPVAAVLARELDGLRREYAAASAADPRRSGAAASPGQ
jgi:multidrug resistance efflux pump